MPGSEEVEDAWKDQDISPERCGFCGSPNIGKSGDFFNCRACGHDWAARVDEANKPASIEQRLERLEKVVTFQSLMLDLVISQLPARFEELMTPEGKSMLAAWAGYRMTGTLPSDGL
jgi:uncharacterized Zn finger protein (UPF0148 family)